MTILCVPSKPPLRQCRLNRRDKLAIGLGALWPFVDGTPGQTVVSGSTQTRNFATETQTTLQSGVTWVNGLFGPCLNFNGSTGYCLTSSFSLNYKQILVSAWINTGSVVGGTRYTVLDTSNTNASGFPSFEIDGETSTSAYLNIIIPGVFLILGGGSDYSNFFTCKNIWNQIFWWIDDANTTAGVGWNGQIIATKNYGAQTFGSGAAQKNIGQRSTGGQQFPGMIDGLVVYNLPPGGATVASLAAMLYADSFRMLRQRRTPRFGSSGGITAFTLVADPGAYTLTGEAATLGIGTPSLAGSLTYTGGSATLNEGLPGAAGSYTLTGQNATLAVAMPASPGSYTLTGQAATLDTGLSGSAGAYTLTGEAATMFAGLFLSASAGAYTLTGQTATFDCGMPDGAGAYTLTGQAAGLLAGAFLQGDPGAYTYTGGVAAFAFAMPGSAGTYTLTGGAAALDRGMPGGAGAYTLTGGAAAFGIAMALAAGAYTLTGQTALLVNSGAVIVVSGTWTEPGRGIVWTDPTRGIVWSGPAMMTLVKRGGELKTYAYDFLNDPVVIGGDPIESLEDYSVLTLGPTGATQPTVVDAPSFPGSGTRVFITLSGGQDDAKFEYTFRVNTVAGSILVGLGRLHVNDDQ